MKNLLSLALAVALHLGCAPFSSAQNIESETHPEIRPCPPSQQLGVRPANGIAKLQRLWNEYSTLQNYTGREEAYELNQVLPLLHPQLVDRSGECTQELYGYTVQVLPALNSEILFDILNEIPVDERNGFALFSPRFWTRAYQLQQQGIQLAWIKSSPRPANGVYFSRQNLIAVDVLGDVATLEHEYRHHVQAHSIERDPWSWRWLERQVLHSYSSSCLPKMITYFKELDATTEDLGYWQDYFDHLEIPANEELFSGSLQEYPQLELFAVNLSYPYQVSQAVLQEPTCSESIKIAVREIWKTLDETNLRSQARKLSQLLFTSQILRRDRPECADSDDSSGVCQTHRNNLAEAAHLRTQLQSLLRPYQQKRRERIRLTLQKVPRADYELLCSYEGAFRLLAGCQGVGEQ